MKHLIKNIAVISMSILFILLSIKSSYAGETNILKSITATSTKTVELQLDKKINKKFTNSDLEIYKSIDNKSTKIEGETNKVLLELTTPIEKNTSYSLISISAIEGNIIFKTGEDIILKEIGNTVLESNEQGIKNILIKDTTHLILTFTQNIDDIELDFQLLKTLEVDKIIGLIDTTKIKATLKGEMLNNEDYLGTITFLENSKLEKIDISKGINYFKTGELVKYEGPTEKELLEEAESNTDMSLEEELMKALGESGDVGSEINSDLEGELNSAAEDPANIEKTQLEKLALSQKETPDTGAETWILLLATFIINTFYVIARRKKQIIL